MASIIGHSSPRSSFDLMAFLLRTAWPLVSGTRSAGGCGSALLGGEQAGVGAQAHALLQHVAELDFQKAGIQQRGRVEDQVRFQGRGLRAVGFEPAGAIGGDGEVDDLELTGEPAARGVAVQPGFEQVFIGLIGGDTPSHVDGGRPEGRSGRRRAAWSRYRGSAQAQGVGGEFLAKGGFAKVRGQLELERVAEVSAPMSLNLIHWGGLPSSRRASLPGAVVADVDEALVIAGLARGRRR